MKNGVDDEDDGDGDDGPSDDDDGANADAAYGHHLHPYQALMMQWMRRTWRSIERWEDVAEEEAEEGEEENDDTCEKKVIMMCRLL